MMNLLHRSVMVVLLLLTLLLLASSSSSFSSAQQQDTSNLVINSNITRNKNLTTFFNEGVYNGAVIDPVNRKGYFATFTNPGLIIKVDLETLAREASLAMPFGIGNFKDGLELCGVAYFPCSTTPRGAFVKIDLNRFELDAVVEGNSGEFNFVAPLSVGDFITFGTQSNPARLIEYNLASLERSRNISLPAANVKSGVSKGNTAYYILGPSGGAICKVDLVIFQVLEFYSNTSLDDFTAISGAFDVHFGSKFIYDASSEIVRYNEPASQSVTYQTNVFPQGFLYVGTGDATIGFLKFNVTENVREFNTTKIFNTSSLPTSIVLIQTLSDSNVNFIVGSFIVREFVFFLQTSSTGVLYRVNATNINYPVFTDTNINETYPSDGNPMMPWIDNISGQTGEDFNVVVTDGVYAYVATNSNPGEILKFHLGITASASSSQDQTASYNKTWSTVSKTTVDEITVGTAADNFGTRSVDVNTTFACSERGRYIGDGFSIRFSPSQQGLVQVRSFNSSLWGLISNDFFDANTASAVCNMLGYNVTWATFHSVGLAPFNNSVRSRESVDFIRNDDDLTNLTTDNDQQQSTNNASLLLTSSALTSIPSSLRSVLHPLDAPVFFDDLRCPFDSRFLSNCSFKVYNLNDAAPTEGIAVNCLAQTSEDEQHSGVVSGEWRFRMATNGRVDVRPAAGNSLYPNYENEQWGTICSKGMSRFTPSGLCRVLGFPFGIGYLTHWVDRVTNSGIDVKLQNSTPIYLSQVYCPQAMRSENFSSDCRYENYNFSLFSSEIEIVDGGFLHARNPQSLKFCNHTYDVGLLCNGSMQSEGVYVGQRMFLRLDPATNGLQVRKLIDVNAVTNKEVYTPSSGWSSICRRNGLSMTTAKALCRMLTDRYSENYVGIISVPSSSLSESSGRVGLKSLSCQDATDRLGANNILNIGNCNYGEAFDSDDENCDDDDARLGLICDAEEKGVLSGDYYWRLQKNTNGTATDTNNAGTTSIHSLSSLQARPAPSFVLEENTSIVNPYPITENFGAVAESIVINNNNNHHTMIFNQDTASTICKIMGFAGTNHQFSSSEILISNPQTDYSDFVPFSSASTGSDNAQIHQQFADNNFTSNYWDELISYNPMINLDKIVLQNLSCSSHNQGALDRSSSARDFCSTFRWQLNASTINVTDLIEGQTFYDASISNTTPASLYFKTGGRYRVVNLYCDPVFMDTSRDVRGIVGFVIGAVVAVLLSFLLVWLLIVMGILRGDEDNEDEDEEEVEEMTEEQRKKFEDKQSRRLRPPPPPPASQTADDDEEDDNEIVYPNPVSSSQQHGRGIVSPGIHDDSDDEEDEHVIIVDRSPNFNRNSNNYVFEERFGNGQLGTRNRYLAGYDGSGDHDNNNNNSNNSSPVIVPAVVSPNRYQFNNNHANNHGSSRALPQAPDDGFGSGYNPALNPPEAPHHLRAIPSYPTYQELSVSRQRGRGNSNEPTSNNNNNDQYHQQTAERQNNTGPATGQPVNRRVLSPNMPTSSSSSKSYR